MYGLYYVFTLVGKTQKEKETAHEETGVRLVYVRLWLRLQSILHVIERGDGIKALKVFFFEAAAGRRKNKISSLFSRAFFL